MSRDRSPDSDFDDDDFLLSPQPGNRQRNFWKILRVWIPKYWKPRTNVVIPCILYLSANVFYVLSLRPASSPAEMNGMLGKLGLFLGLSVAMYSTHFWMAVSRQPNLVVVLYEISRLVFTLGACYFIDSGNTLEAHGSYNLLIFCLMLIPVNCIVAVLYLWYSLIDERGHGQRLRKFGKQLAGVCVAVGLLFFFSTRYRKNELKYGFFDHESPCTKVQRENGICKSCQWEETIPWFDLLPFRQNFFTGPMSCPADDTFTARIENDTLFIEGCDVFTESPLQADTSEIIINRGPLYSYLPRTETWGLTLKNDSLNRPYNGFQDSVLKSTTENTFPYSSPTAINDDVDSILIHCGSRPPKLVYRIQPTLPVEPETRMKPMPNETLNVITLFIDAMSRNNFHRRLPRTRKALEKLATSSASPSNLYELFRYHSVGINTTPNTRALWTGIDETNSTAAGKPIWEQFEESGYTSARVDPMCQDWSAYYNPASFPPTEYIKPRISHEHIAFSCFPPTVPVGEANSGNFAGPASIKSRCFSDTHVGWHVLDWSSEFISTYQGREPFFLSAAFMEAHEGSGEVLRTLDARLESFFDRDTSPVDWNKTAVAIVSDHGALMGLNNVFFENGKVEAKNPFAAFILPKWYMKEERRHEKLTQAHGELVTPHDIYETMRGFKRDSFQGLETRRGRDMLRESIGDRTCSEAGISENMCRCR